MGSQLIGLRKSLTWTEFTGTPTAAELAELRRIAASSGKTVGMAGTRSFFTAKFAGKDEATLTPSGSGFTLADEVTVTVVFDPKKSWRRTDGLSALTSQFLLDHEQGHYDFSALMARDCFIDLMQLKAQTFPDQATGKSAAKTIVDTYKSRLDKIQDAYDFDTTHGGWVVPGSGFLPPRKESFQVKWEGFITSAFMTERVPQVVAPDGAIYKTRILDVLASRGVQI